MYFCKIILCTTTCFKFTHAQTFILFIRICTQDELHLRLFSNVFLSSKSLEYMYIVLRVDSCMSKSIEVQPLGLNVLFNGLFM